MQADLRGLLAIIGCLASQLAWCNADQREALAVVVAHFTARTDLLSMHNDGVTLVQPTARAWSIESLRVFSLLSRSGTCGITRGMYDALAKVDAGPTDVTDVLPKSSRWRTLKPNDLPDRSLGLDKTVSGEKIKTVAQLSSPGITQGDEALLLVSFKWSMHDAVAQYVLRRDRGGWEVKCSELVFYP